MSLKVLLSAKASELVASLHLRELNNAIVRVVSGAEA